MQLTVGESKFDVPVGTYAARLTECAEKPSKTPGWGPQLAWNFEITDGPLRGKVATCWTGTDPSLKSGLGKLLRELLGRPIQVGEVITPEQFYGQPFLVTVGLNRDGDKTRVIMVQPVGSPQAAAAVATGPSQQPAPAAAAAPAPAAPGSGPAEPPPPRRPQPAQADAPKLAREARQFWVFESDTAETPVRKSEADLSHWMATLKLDPSSVTCCLVGERDYKKASDYGVLAIPF
jgi:pyruvate/2-oxoglutarate dehydrogenase complex dihydrolipoamide acyltransferase (E2) component